jgi:hypothetical protein
MSQEEKPKTRNQSYKEKRQLLLRDIKMKSGCVICGYKEHWAALDFHHRDPTTKLFNISRKITIKKTVLMEEISKCSVVCVNCHRRIK